MAGTEEVLSKMGIAKECSGPLEMPWIAGAVSGLYEFPVAVVTVPQMWWLKSTQISYSSEGLKS